MKNEILKIGNRAKIASKKKINYIKKNKVLLDFANLIEKNKKKIIKQNYKDIHLARKNNLKENLIKRLELNEKKLKEIITSIKNIIKIKDPVDNTLANWSVKSGLKIKRVTVPIGVIGVIYESRPNVTSDVSCLCFKSGNSVILKGGSEAFYSNLIISNLFRRALIKNKINKNFVQFIKKKDRKVVKFILSKMKHYIDVIIPRGGKNLVATVQKFSNIPVIGHLEGVCHTYIDKFADLSMSKKIIYNAKMRNTSMIFAMGI